MFRTPFDPPAIVKPDNALAELAGRINAEHEPVETALRAGLEHARAAGELLLQAKAQCRHGEWLSWLKANVRCSERTAQAYMRLIKCWPELEAKAQHVADLSYRDALQVLAAPVNEDANPQHVADLSESDTADAPPALAFYRDAGLLDEECIRLLMELEADYGPEIAAPFNDKPFDPDMTAQDSFWLLFAAFQKGIELAKSERSYAYFSSYQKNRLLRQGA